VFAGSTQRTSSLSPGIGLASQAAPASCAFAPEIVAAISKQPKTRDFMQGLIVDGDDALISPIV
jgi:hypothetical protein